MTGTFTKQIRKLKVNYTRKAIQEEAEKRKNANFDCYVAVPLHVIFDRGARVQYLIWGIALPGEPDAMDAEHPELTVRYFLRDRNLQIKEYHDEDLVEDIVASLNVGRAARLAGAGPGCQEEKRGRKTARSSRKKS